MLPIRDDNPTSRVAWVTVLLILANVGVYLFVQPADSARFTYEYAAVPCEITTGEALSAGEISPALVGIDDANCVRSGEPAVFPGKNVFLAVVTSLFLHGSIAHLAGNMLFLWVFGNNVEDRLGPVPYLLFYLVAGVLATLAHVALQPDSTIPVIGASGAIAGVMGAYLIWFPRARVLSLFFVVVAPIRAQWLLLAWFVQQFFVNPNEGVAWAAHVGGFVAGALIALLLRPRRLPAR